jgi:hypothetical protein
MITNSFENDIKYIFDKLKRRENFSFSKYADGEFMILADRPIVNCDGWKFDPRECERERELLVNSFLYDHDDYYVGISCRCCQPLEYVQWMREEVGTKNVTWANLFVNSNYKFFLENFIKEFDKWESFVTFVGHKNGLDKKLPFKVDNYIPIDIGYWKTPHVFDIIDVCSDLSSTENNQLFLFSAGPLGNILSHKLHEINPNNTYLDIGSTVNPWIVGKNRTYLNNGSSLNKVCIW